MAQLKISQGIHDYFIMITIILLMETYDWNDPEVVVDYVIFKNFCIIVKHNAVSNTKLDHVNSNRFSNKLGGLFLG